MGRPRAIAAALAVLVTVVGAGCSASRPHAAPSSTAASTAASTPSAIAAPSTGPATRSSTTPASRTATTPSRTPTSKPTSKPSSKPHTAAAHRPSGRRLPLAFPTDGAGQAITVIAPSTSSTQAVLQAWRRVTGGWQRVGPPVPAWLGSDGLSTHPSENRSATPIGSFTLTQAFGHDADPGTALPYVRTTPADWWVSQPGPLYNTRQRCAAGCPFTQGDPNEHLYYETPYYDFAVVIDYNTSNAPGGVRQGAGSAFFLHVTVGQPTAGCVSIDRAQLVRILRWLRPAEHPRILIGTT